MDFYGFRSKDRKEIFQQLVENTIPCTHIRIFNKKILCIFGEAVENSKAPKKYFKPRYKNLLECTFLLLLIFILRTMEDEKSFEEKEILFEFPSCLRRILVRDIPISVPEITERRVEYVYEYSYMSYDNFLRLFQFLDLTILLRFVICKLNELSLQLCSSRWL